MPSDIQAEILPDPHAKDSVTEEFQFSRCSSGWPGPPETYENLRTKEAVFGTIWGCRMSKITLGAKITEEKWIDEHGIMVSDDLDNRLTRRHIIQTLRSLNFEAPDPAQFQPPKDYEVEDLQWKKLLARLRLTNSFQALAIIVPQSGLLQPARSSPPRSLVPSVPVP